MAEALYAFERLFLFFVWYSMVGWCMESIFCSVRAGRWINRGFLHLPICPIYAVGALIGSDFFTPWVASPLLFYLVATVVMSAWEYFVGWVLETTTHMKYWDYSSYRFHLHGRICLVNCLWWGIAAYLTIFFLHPQTQSVVTALPMFVLHVLFAVLVCAVLADTAITVRDLALLRQALIRAESMRVQLELGRMELHQRLQVRREIVRNNLLSAHESVSETLENAHADLVHLEAEHARILEQSVDTARRFLLHYRGLSSPRYPEPFSDLRTRVKERRNRRKRRVK